MAIFKSFLYVYQAGNILSPGLKVPRHMALGTVGAVSCRCAPWPGLGNFLEVQFHSTELRYINQLVIVQNSYWVYMAIYSEFELLIVLWFIHSSYV